MLSQNGILLITTPVPASRSPFRIHRPTHVSELPTERWVDLMREAGLRVLSSGQIPLCPLGPSCSHVGALHAVLESAFACIDAYCDSLTSAGRKVVVSKAATGCKGAPFPSSVQVGVFMT